MPADNQTSVDSNLHAEALELSTSWGVQRLPSRCKGTAACATFYYEISILDLILSGGLLGLGDCGLHQLDCGLKLFLERLQALLRPLKLCLQLLEHRVVRLLRGADTPFHIGHLAAQLVDWHRKIRLESCLLLLVALVQRVDRACRAKGLSELLERFQVALALVRLPLRVRGVEILESWVALHAVFLANRFAAIRSAVHVADDHLLGVLECFTEIVPIGLHLLAVPSPRGLELDESALA
mmetsp:Transcript_18244/g.40852  ORF Transcript_18244/g.40852 Transcript_18244/m.40852 type:complete len:239 (+) Transcript_18244:188-904(+)